MVIEAIVAALVAALAKEAPGALVALLRSLGILPADMTDEAVSQRLQSAADILGDVNPMHAVRPRRRVVIVPPPPDPAKGDHWPDEYQRPESD